MSDFEAFAKIPRYNREVVVTEKIDGTNAQICVNDTGDDFLVGSRNRWLEHGKDNFGFYAWTQANKAELLKLGPGRHFGEWWGGGVQRGYGLGQEKRFSLFNVHKWAETRPACCHVVPVLWRGNLEDMSAPAILEALKNGGSRAAPGFMNPEGIIIFHTAGGHLYKKTYDDGPKGT